MSRHSPTNVRRLCQHLQTYDHKWHTPDALMSSPTLNIPLTTNSNCEWNAGRCQNLLVFTFPRWHLFECTCGKRPKGGLFIYKSQDALATNANNWNSWSSCLIFSFSSSPHTKTERWYSNGLGCDAMREEFHTRWSKIVCDLKLGIMCKWGFRYAVAERAVTVYFR